jgi:hypothetical protein
MNSSGKSLLEKCIALLCNYCPFGDKKGPKGDISNF